MCCGCGRDGWRDEGAAKRFHRHHHTPHTKTPPARTAQKSAAASRAASTCAASAGPRRPRPRTRRGSRPRARRILCCDVVVCVLGVLSFFFLVGGEGGDKGVESERDTFCQSKQNPKGGGGAGPSQTGRQPPYCTRPTHAPRRWLTTRGHHLHKIQPANVHTPRTNTGMPHARTHPAAGEGGRRGACRGWTSSAARPPPAQCCCMM